MKDIKFEDILKNIEVNNTLWFSALLSAYLSETKWIYNHQGLVIDLVEKDKLFLMPYMINTCRVFKKIDKNLKSGDGMISSFLLRGFLERIALISYGLNHTKDEFKEVIDSFMSNDTGRRQGATDTFLNHLQTIFPLSKQIYNLLSRYFSHISYVESFSNRCKVSENFADDYMNNDGSMHYGYLLYVVIVFDVINLYSKLIEKHVANKSERKYITRKFSVKNEKIIFICKSLFGGYFTKKNPLKISMLYKNVKNMNGDVGITNVYKNKMQIVWFGKDDKPNFELLKEMAIFIVGSNHNYKKHLKIYCRSKDKNSATYEIEWDKSLHYNKTAILFASTNIEESTDSIFIDYIDKFMKHLAEYNLNVSNAN